MTDDQTDLDPEGEGQKSETDAALAKLKAENELLVKQSEALTRDYKEAEKRMHEATTQAAETNRRLKAIEESKPQFTEKDLEKFRDDPAAIVEHMAQQRARDQADFDARLKQATEGLTQELASYLTQEKQEVEQRFKALDPRLNSQEFKSLKERLGTDDDEMVLKVMELDGSRPPSAPAGTQTTPPKRKPDEAHPALKSAFGATLDRLAPKEAK